MVFEHRSYGSVRAPPLPIIRDSHSASHFSPTTTTTTTTITTNSKGNSNGLSPKCNGSPALRTALGSEPHNGPAIKCAPAAARHPSSGLHSRPISPPASRSHFKSRQSPAPSRQPSVTFQTRPLRRPLTVGEYEADFRQHASDLQLVERVFFSGLDSNQLRAALWPYIFGLVRERGRFVRRTSHSASFLGNGAGSPASGAAAAAAAAVAAGAGAQNGHGRTNNGHGARPTSSANRKTSAATQSDQFVYIEHELNVKRWRELERLYAAYEGQWKSIMPDQELRFSVFRERKSLIERDVVRSDRTHPFYAHDSEAAARNLENLSSLLMTYMMYDFDIGYLQGMSDLAAPILYVYQGDLVRAFWVFVEVMKLFRRNFEQSQKSIHFQLNCLNRLIKMTDPKLANYLRENDCSNCFFVFRCIVCQFKRELMKSSTSRASSEQMIHGERDEDEDEDEDDQHSDLTSTTDDDDDDEGDNSSLDGGRQQRRRANLAADEDSYAKVLNLWDTIWSVQRRHELLAKSKCVHTFTIATNGTARKSASSAQHKHPRHHHSHSHNRNHNHDHHHRHHHHHHHHHHQQHLSTKHNQNGEPRMSSPINISSTTSTCATNGDDAYQNGDSPRVTTTSTKSNHLSQKLAQAHNAIPRSAHSTTSNHATPTTTTTTTTTTTRLNNQLTQQRTNGRRSPVLMHNGFAPSHNQQHRQQLLKRHSVSSVCSLGSACSLGSCCSLASAGGGNSPRSNASGATAAPVKQEQIVYTKETFYSSFDPNQADVPRFELTETEKFVLALCASLIRRERNSILSHQMDASEIHQHFINPPRLAENFDAFTEQAYETYLYLNTDCDLQLLVKGASELSGGAASDLSPICAPGLPGQPSQASAADSADTADTYDLLKDYLVISPTSYNVSLSSLNNLPGSNNNSFRISSSNATSENTPLPTTTSCGSIGSSSSSNNNNNNNNNNHENHLHHQHNHLHNRYGQLDCNGVCDLNGHSAGLAQKRPSLGGASGTGIKYSVSQKSWDHFLNSETLNLQ